MRILHAIALALGLLAGAGCAPQAIQWEATVTARSGAPATPRESSSPGVVAARPDDRYVLELLALEKHVCSDVVDTFGEDAPSTPRRAKVSTTTFIESAGAVYRRDERCEIEH